MKASEIKEITSKELMERIDETTNHLTRLRLNHAVSPLDNPRQMTNLKKDLARMKTELRAREIKEMPKNK